MRDRRLAKVERAIQVDTHHPSVVLTCHVRSVCGSVDARHVPEDIESPICLHAFRDGGHASVRVADVGDVDANPLSYEIGSLFEGRVVDVNRENGATFFYDPNGHRPTDSGARARNQRDLSRKSVHGG